MKEEHIQEYKLLYTQYGGSLLTDSAAKDQLVRLVTLLTTLSEIQEQSLTMVDHYSFNTKASTLIRSTDA